MNQNKISTAMIARLAIMTALSVVLMLIVRIPFPPAPFLVYDPADVPIYITAFALGPMAGLLVTFVVCFIQAFILGGDGIYGFLMHFIATGTVVVVIGVMYSRCRTKKRAIQALLISIIISTAVMCGMNLIITPIFIGAPIKAVLAMIPTVILPFNLAKSVVNSLLTFVLYKRISGFLRKGEVIKQNKA